MGEQAIRQPGPIQGIALLLPITMAVMGIVLLVPVMPEILHEFANVPQAPYLVQLVLTLPAGCVLLFSPVAGWIADRHGRRRPLMIAMAVYALMGILPIFLTSIWTIILSRVGVGICEAVIMTATTTMISDYFHGRTRERWLASQTAVASLSALGLLKISGLLGQSYGWRGPFGVYLFSLVLLLGIWRFTWEPAEGAAIAQPRPHASARPDAVPWARLLGICALTVFAAVMFYSYQTQSGLALDALGVHDMSRRGTAAMIAALLAGVKAPTPAPSSASSITTAGSDACAAASRQKASAASPIPATVGARGPARSAMRPDNSAASVRLTGRMATTAPAAAALSSRSSSRKNGTAKSAPNRTR